jgi:hypothetical protein
MWLIEIIGVKHIIVIFVFLTQFRKRKDGMSDMDEYEAPVRFISTPCSKTRPCGRHELCPTCMKRMASRKLAQLFEALDMVQHLRPTVRAAGVLTRTLPGYKHKSRIRGAPLFRQYEYANDLIRGNNCRTENQFRLDIGAVGGITVFEAVKKPGKSWHLHTHEILFESINSPITLRASDVQEFCRECDKELDECDLTAACINSGTRRKVGGRWNNDLSKMGWGRRYSWDPHEDIGVGYLVKFAYVIKAPQFEEELNNKDRQELAMFYRNTRPRMIRRWGCARIAPNERELYDYFKSPDREDWV